MKKILAFMLMLILLLLCTGCAEESLEEYPYGIKIYGLNIQVSPVIFNTPEEHIEHSDNIFEGIVIDISPTVFNKNTLSPQRLPVIFDDPENYQLMMVYTVLVTQAYKGNVGAIEQVVIEDGNWWQLLKERKNALERVGLYDPEIGVQGYQSSRKLEKMETYLFCVSDAQNGYMRPNNWVVGIESDRQGAADIKAQLTPQFPPLLTLGIIVVVLAAVAAVTTVLLIRRKKRKATPEETEQIPEET